ncbi:MAG: peptidylprolyl isomerase [Lysobacterales bacterium]
MFKALFTSSLLLVSALAGAETVAPAAAAASDVKSEAAEVAVNPKPKVRLSTNMGTIVLELDALKAPKSVANFLQYVKDKHYDGTIFHRVIPGFMVQGGGFTQDLSQKRTRASIVNEADNGLSNTVGTVAMARTGDPHSATAQFFINVADNRRLDFVSKANGMTWGYAVFGRVIEGMPVVMAIKDVERGAKGPFASDVPVSPVLIIKAEAID